MAVEAADADARASRCSCASTPTRAIGPFQPYDAAIAAYPPEPIDDEQLGAAMLYSSGTTGRPKGILRPLPEVHPSAPLPLMDFVRQMFMLREGMTYLSPAPLYHSAPQASVSATMRLGGTSVIMESFDPEQYLQLVEQHRITHSQVVPTMFSRMLKLPVDVRTKYDLSSLETIIHAAAPCPVQVKQEMIEWFGPKLIEYYGATEANGFTWCDSEQWLAHPGTVGRADRRRAADPRRRRQRGADGHDRHGVVRRRHELHVLQRPGEDGREPQRQRHSARPSATSATSTRTATSTSPTARRT